MDTVSLGSQIVDTFLEGVTGLGSGLGRTIVDTFNSVVMTSDGKLSNLAIWGLVFGGSALIIGVVKHFARKAG